MSAIRKFFLSSSAATGFVRGMREDFLSLKRIYWARRQKRLLQEYVRTRNVRKLQLGTGENILQGWLNTDLTPWDKSKVFFLDATKTFPFNDETFDFILSEHHIEHLSFQEGVFMLAECHRVLKPQGKIRIATPDLRALANLCTENADPLSNRFVAFVTDHLIQEDYLPKQDFRSLAYVINNAFYNPEWKHKFLYEPHTLTRLMEQTGFQEVREFRPGESDEVELKGIEGHGHRLGNEEVNQFETIVLQAVKRPPRF